MKWVWIPNAICILRIALVWPTMAAILEERWLEALLLFMVAGASDGLDGFLAKRFHWQTRLGGLLDPVADKLLIVSVYVTLSFVGLVPIGLTVIVIARDLVIVTGATLYQVLVEPLQAQPSLVSKFNTLCQLAFVVLTLLAGGFGLPLTPALTALGALVVLTSTTSGLNYVMRWTRQAAAIRAVRP